MELVLPVRRIHKRLGGKKMYAMLTPNIRQISAGLGRDKFFDLLRKNGLLVLRKRKYAVTTQSYHRFRVYKNLVRDEVVTAPNRVWVSDITYIRRGAGFMYLFLITDAYSRKIVGWSLRDSLGLEGALRALRMALRQCQDPQRLIHHSDRGFQYCSEAYTGLLKKNGVRISMAAAGNCYENALAERINGILKQEYSLDQRMNDEQMANRTVGEAIRLYNDHRPHWSLGLQIPSKVHEKWYEK